MKNQLAKTLAPVASIAYQRKYIGNPTKDNYDDMDEMFQEVYGILRLFESNKILSANIQGKEREAIEKFAVIFRNMAPKVPGDVDFDALEKNKAFQLIRMEALKCLNALGFDLHGWEKSECA